MAKIVSHVWSGARGKVAGIVYFNGPGNPILARQWVNPVNPNSESQQQLRNSITIANDAWLDIGETNRANYKAWSEASGFSPTGRATYIGQRTWWEYGLKAGYVSDAFDESVPNVVGIPAVIIEEVGYEGGVNPGIAWKLENPTTFTINVVLQRSIALRSTRHFWKGPFMQAWSTVVLAAGATQNLDLVMIGALPNVNCAFTRFTPYISYNVAPNANEGSVKGQDLILRQIVQPGSI